MNKTILNFINKVEGWKTAIKNLHWDASSLSQHKEADNVSYRIEDFQDTVSEVEQSISGKLPLNQLKPVEYKIENIQSFLKDVIGDTTAFYKELKGMGDEYIGLCSECESFIMNMQKEVYLINFTLKEDFKRKYANKINEGKCLNVTKSELAGVIKEAIGNTIGKLDSKKASKLNEAEEEEPVGNGIKKMTLDGFFSMLKETFDEGELLTMHYGKDEDEITNYDDKVYAIYDSKTKKLIGQYKTSTETYTEF